jgi:hypothetical protein
MTTAPDPSAADQVAEFVHHMEVVALVIAGGAVLTFTLLVVLVFWAAWRGRLTIGPVRVSRRFWWSRTRTPQWDESFVPGPPTA